MKRAFTLIELLIVVAMLGLLMATAATGMAQARLQAKKTKAHAEMRELVNAWLSYEQSFGDFPMDITTGETEATAAALADLLGSSGGPVFLNAPISNGAFRDPWGNPYKFRILSIEAVDDKEYELDAAVTFPNRHRDWRR